MKTKPKAKTAKKPRATTPRSRRAVAATPATKPSAPAPSADTSAPPTGSETAKRVRGSSAQASATARRKVFIEAYIANGGNMTQAALTAGFSAKTAAQQGSRLFNHVEVQAEIATRQKELQEKHELTTDRVLREVARIALYDPRRLFNEDGSLKKVMDLDDDTAAAIASVEVDEIGTQGTFIGFTKKVKAWDKNAALEKAMKHLGLFEKDKDPPAPPPNVNVNIKVEPSEAYMRMIGK